MQELHGRFFQDPTPTDVISFPLADSDEDEFLGEVVVSVEEALLQSKKNRWHWHKELSLYIIHGVLHLLGEDDRTQPAKRRMRRLQMRIVQRVFQ